MADRISVPFDLCPLTAVRYRHTEPSFRGVILYFHGGGLVFGMPDDLPRIYIDMLCGAGYDLVVMDYPLAPEASLSDLLRAVHTQVSFVLTQPEQFGWDSVPPYFLFGRSAGAYLILNEAKRLCCTGPAPEAADVSGTGNSSLTEVHPRPAGLLSFYGYPSFDYPEFHRPSAFYKKLPVTEPRIPSAAAGDPVITKGPMDRRYALYVFARQSGIWTSLLGTGAEIAAAAVSAEELPLLPPGFFTASSCDQDVPFRASKTMARTIPGSTFFPVYFLEHDFDRDTSKPDGRNAYAAALEFMDRRLSG